MSTLLSKVVARTDALREKRATLISRSADAVSRLTAASANGEKSEEQYTVPFDAQPRRFLKALRRDVAQHPAVNHPLLARIAHVPFTKQDYRVFALQHYPLVGTFTSYLERLLLRAPDSDAKQWIAKVLVDEYGEGSDGEDHAALYRTFLAATGAEAGEEEETRLHPNVTGFIAEHIALCEDEPFLVGLGAVGPGHEWAIPKMFQQLVQGLRRAGFEPQEMLYFDLHMDQDEDHGAWLEEALVRYATTEEAQAQIYRGAMRSLQARARLWAGVQDKIVRWRQPKNLHVRSQARAQALLKKGQLSFAQWRGLISGDGGKS